MVKQTTAQDKLLSSNSNTDTHQLSFKSKGKWSVFRSNMPGKINRHMQAMVGKDSIKSAVWIVFPSGLHYISEVADSLQVRSRTVPVMFTVIGKKVHPSVTMVNFHHLIGLYPYCYHKPACVANCRVLAINLPVSLTVVYLVHPRLLGNILQSSYYLDYRGLVCK